MATKLPSLEEFRSSQVESELPSLEQYRAANPQLRTEIPAEPSSFKRGVGSVMSPTGTALKNFGLTNIGQTLQDKGDALVRANPSATPDLASMAASPLTATKESMGELAPQMISQVILSAIGGVVGNRLGGTQGAVIGAQALGAVPTFLAETGGVLRQQEVTGQPIDRTKALAAGAANTAIEFTAGVQPMVSKLATQILTGKAKDIVADATVKGVLGQAVKQGLKTSAGEGLEEIPQNAISELGANGNPLTAASLEEGAYGASRAFLGSLPLGIAGGGINQRMRNTQIIAAEQERLAPINAERARIDAIASQAQAEARARKVEVEQDKAKEGYYNTLAEQGDIVGIRFENPKFKQDLTLLANQKIIDRDTPVEKVEAIAAKVAEGKPIDLAVAETNRELADARVPVLEQQLAALKEAKQPTANVDKELRRAKRESINANNAISAFEKTRTDLTEKVAAAANGTPEEFTKAKAILEKFEADNEAKTTKTLPILQRLQEDMAAVRDIRRSVDTTVAEREPAPAPAEAQPTAEDLFKQREAEQARAQAEQEAVLLRSVREAQGEQDLQSALDETARQEAIDAQPPLTTQLQTPEVEAKLRTVAERAQAAKVEQETVKATVEETTTRLTSALTAAKDGKTTPAQAAAQVRAALKGVDMTDPVAVATAIVKKANDGSITFAKIAEANPDLVAPLQAPEGGNVSVPAESAPVVTPEVTAKPEPAAAPSWETDETALITELEAQSANEVNEKIIRDDMRGMRAAIKNAATGAEKAQAIAAARKQIVSVNNYNAQKAAAPAPVQVDVVKKLRQIVDSSNSTVEAAREANSQLLKFNTKGFKASDVDLAAAQAVVDKHIGAAYSVDSAVTAPSSVQAVSDAFANLFRRGTSNAFAVYDTVEEAVKANPALRVLKLRSDAGAFVYGKKAYMIARNIQQGRERSVIMHELGSHVGLESILSAGRIKTLANSVRSWADKGGTVESGLAQRALARVAEANTSETQRDQETIAYFIEEAVNAGINPSMIKTGSKFGQWIRTVYAAFKRVLVQAGITNLNNLSGQDLVDMAYGAANAKVNAAQTSVEMDAQEAPLYSIPAQAMGPGAAQLHDVLNGVVLNDPSITGVMSRFYNMGAKDSWEVIKGNAKRFMVPITSPLKMRRDSAGYRNSWDHMQDMTSVSKYIQNETMDAIHDEWIAGRLGNTIVNTLTRSKSQTTQDTEQAIAHLNKWNRDRTEPTVDTAAPWYKKVQAFRKAADGLLETQKITELESLRKSITDDVEYDKVQRQVFDHFERLKAEGYLPDRGRGPYTIGLYSKEMLNGEYPKSGKGLIKRFMFETESEARNALKEIKDLIADDDSIVLDTVGDKPIMLSQEAIKMAQNNTTTMFQFFDLAQQAGIVLTPEARNTLIAKLLSAESILHNSIQNRRNLLGGQQDVIRALSEMAVNTSVAVSRARVMPRIMASLNNTTQLSEGERMDLIILREKFAQYSNVAEATVRKTILEEQGIPLGDKIKTLTDYNRMLEFDAWGYDKWNGFSDLETAELDELRSREGQLTPAEEQRKLELSTPKTADSAMYNDEAKKLLASLIDPATDGLAGLRHIAALNFLGGSVASALLNLTSIPMFLAPVLYGHSGANAYSTIAGVSARVGAGLGNPNSIFGALVLRGDDGPLRAAIAPGGTMPEWMNRDMAQSMLRAYEEGLIAEQQTYDLYALDKHGVNSANIFTHKAAQAWMAPFRVTESMNRVVAFQAAYEIGAEKGLTGEALYDFSREIVNDTMFVYGRLGRPAIARNPVGLAFMTFRMFPLMAVELIAHMKGSQRTIMLGSLLLASGLNGVPGGDDLKDIIDTVMQRVFGKPFNSNRVIHNYLKMATEAMTGYDMSDLLMYGALDTLTGASLGARMSLGNLVPGTRIGAAGQDLSRNLEEITGAVGAEVAGWAQGAQALLKGDTGRAWKEAAPASLKRITQMNEAIETGQITDINGNKMVDDVTVYEQTLLGLGFSLARQHTQFQDNRQVMDSMAYATEQKQAFRREIMEGMQDKDAAKIRDTNELIRAWNKSYPEYRIEFNRATLIRDLRAKGLTPTERNLKTIPREWRRAAADDLQNEE